MSYTQAGVAEAAERSQPSWGFFVILLMIVALLAAIVWCGLHDPRRNFAPRCRGAGGVPVMMGGDHVCLARDVALPIDGSGEQ